MDLKEAIYTRRAVREFTVEEADDKTIRELIDAAIQAPSAVNHPRALTAGVRKAQGTKSQGGRQGRSELAAGYGDLKGAPVAARSGKAKTGVSFDGVDDAAGTMRRPKPALSGRKTANFELAWGFLGQAPGRPGQAQRQSRSTLQRRGGAARAS